MSSWQQAMVFVNDASGDNWSRCPDVSTIVPMSTLGNDGLMKRGMP
jgi:hypothetical protein